jgi:hypothetical protein
MTPDMRSDMISVMPSEMTPDMISVLIGFILYWCGLKFHGFN